MRRLLRNIGWLLSGRAVNAVLSLVYLALATRTLGMEAFGYFALIIAIGQTVTGLANFQTWQFVVRWGSEPRGAGEATGFAIALDMLSVVIGTAIAAALVWSAQHWLPLPGDLLWVAFGYCIVSLLSMRSTPTGLLRLRFQFGRATAAEAVQPMIRALGAILAALFMPSVLGFILAWAAAEVAVALALWAAAAWREKIDFSQISLWRLPREHPGAWRFVWSTNMSGSLTVGGKQVMILLVGAIGGEAFAGGFRVASQLGQALVQLAQTVSKAIYPELVHAQDEAHDMARRMANIALIGGALAVLFALVFGRWGLEAIAGPEFGVVYWAMVILAIAGAIELVGASLESLLVSAGRAGTAFLVRAVPTVLALLLLETAMGWNGLKGAAFTVLGSSALAVIGFWVAIISLQQIKITVERKSDGIG
ncbi:lipopolysaccharide biosynthesis protein [Pelagerythrobacter marinus]|jgi:O-antigen/teichoic acid export membrane protein|uniref:Oligosaccharide flippase family protein n=1 Tax=Pelagerythrobacter marinus TaxID=538382 RepID=A0ABW9V0F7_9SPHN|nr:lipopolysaccharide biosynthesis protein [Pelagerythrobacter marinus]MXO69525.1 oligosaccharide flippase family protein [Pelagerythrobacter marinus]USA39429.1 lipopolysaccharide biosynthesis protein [Pelagerythrobacter marinus]WPZ06431.1 lipopolysaccharide biosynthesis protein [Pelagerythrobacter marinus]